MKEETLEEAAREYWKRGQFGLEKAADTERAFLRGGKWQADKMYSEEEVIKIVEKSRETGLTAEFLLLTEQFKKK